MPKLLLFDAFSLIYRAFYAIRQLTGPEGQPVNALYGFVRMTRKMLAEQHPSHAAVVFDLGAPQYRLAILPSYKEHRPPTPPELERQLPIIREYIQAMRLPIVEREGEEADDLIATLAVTAARDGADVLIASSDKDFMQLVDPHIKLLRPDAKDTGICDDTGVESRFGVRPEQMLDYLCLVGDSVDNIPGVTGVGEKTATALLRQYGSLANLLASLDTLSKPKLRATLAGATAQLQANRQLIGLRCDVSLPVRWDELSLQAQDTERLATLYRTCGFKSLLAELEKASVQTPDLFAGF